MRPAWGGGCAVLRGHVSCEKGMMTGRLEGKGVGLEAMPMGSSDSLLGIGSLEKGVMASHGYATNKIKEFLEI